MSDPTSTESAPQINLSRVEHITITDSEGQSQQYVAAAVYTEVVDARDDMHRHLALINAWRLHYAHLIDEPAAAGLHRLLAEIGETVEIGQAVRSIAVSLGVTNPRWVVTGVSNTPGVVKR